jgi:hypothetical protein
VLARTYATKLLLILEIGGVNPRLFTSMGSLGNNFNVLKRPIRIVDS